MSVSEMLLHHRNQEIADSRAQLDAALSKHAEDEAFVDWCGNVLAAVAFDNGHYEHVRETAECAYCGHIGPRTPDAMTGHATHCKKHPLAKALKDLAAALEFIDETDNAEAFAEWKAR